MSFSIEFIAKDSVEAAKIVGQEYLPDSIKQFLWQALSAYPEGPVKVKAAGHLFNEPHSYKVSNASIEVSQVAFREPKPD